MDQWIIYIDKVDIDVQMNFVHRNEDMTHLRLLHLWILPQFKAEDPKVTFRPI